jgi:large subunit ribosomal protein L15
LPRSPKGKVETLKLAKIIGNHITSSKIILHGVITKPIEVSGLQVTKGARAAINAVGGKVEG